MLIQQCSKIQNKILQIPLLTTHVFLSDGARMGLGVEAIVHATK